MLLYLQTIVILHALDYSDIITHTLTHIYTPTHTLTHTYTPTHTHTHTHCRWWPALPGSAGGKWTHPKSPAYLSSLLYVSREASLRM
jgi:hypothetical protein